MIGLVATLAPTIGPTVGGYLTDTFSWHWLFLVNVVPGHRRRTRRLVPRRFRQARSWSLLEALRLVVGLAGMAMFLGITRIRARGRPAPMTGSTIETIALLSPSSDVVGAIVFFWRAATAQASRSSISRPSAIATSPSALPSPSSWASASTASPISIRSISRRVRGYDAHDDRRDDVRHRRRDVPRPRRSSAACRTSSIRAS